MAQLTVTAQGQVTFRVDEFLGLLAGKTRKIATLDEIAEAVEQGWARESKGRQ